MSSPYGACYITVTILRLALLQDFGMCQYLGTGSVKERLCGLGGAPTRTRGSMRKASSMLACRQGGCRRHLRSGRAVISRGRAAGTYYFPARGTSDRLNAQLPLPIPSSAANACEQAVSRELLLPLTRDTVLAAVPCQLLSLRGWPGAAVQRAAAHE